MYCRMQLLSGGARGGVRDGAHGPDELAARRQFRLGHDGSLESESAARDVPLSAAGAPPLEPVPPVGVLPPPTSQPVLCVMGPGRRIGSLAGGLRIAPTGAPSFVVIRGHR